jgi:hypothetical protein
MTTLILAGGEGSRWNNYLGVPKHLIPIKGEPLIHRTQRMLHERGVEDVRVVCKPEDADLFVLPKSIYQPMESSSRDWQQHQESSRYAWNNHGKTTLIFGDLYITDRLMDAIVNESGEPWRIIARWEGSKFTGKPYGEIFAWIFGPDAHQIIDASREKAITWLEEGKWFRVNAWEIFRDAIGLPINQYEGGNDSIHAIEWDDQSDDFDFPKDWDIWSQLNPKLAF